MTNNRPLTEGKMMSGGINCTSNMTPRCAPPKPSQTKEKNMADNKIYVEYNINTETNEILITKLNGKECDNKSFDTYIYDNMLNGFTEKELDTIRKVLYNELHEPIIDIEFDEADDLLDKIGYPDVSI